MDVRSVTERDWPQLQAHWPSSVGVLRAQQSPPAGRRTTLLVAWEEETPLGSGVIQWDGPTGERARETFSDAVEINHLYVQESARGRGIGTALIAEAERVIAAAGYSRVLVAVAEDNPRARALYERLGYEPTDCVELTRYRYQDADGVWQDAEEQDRALVRRLA